MRHAAWFGSVVSAALLLSSAAPAQATEFEDIADVVQARTQRAFPDAKNLFTWRGLSAHHHLLSWDSSVGFDHEVFVAEQHPDGKLKLLASAPVTSSRYGAHGVANGIGEITPFGLGITRSAEIQDIADVVLARARQTFPHAGKLQVWPGMTGYFANLSPKSSPKSSLSVEHHVYVTAEGADGSHELIGVAPVRTTRIGRKEAKHDVGQVTTLSEAMDQMLSRSETNAEGWASAPLTLGNLRPAAGRRMGRSPAPTATRQRRR